MMSSPVGIQAPSSLPPGNFLPVIQQFKINGKVWYGNVKARIQSINGNNAVIIYENKTTELVPLSSLSIRTVGGTVKRKNRKILIKKTIRQNKKFGP